MLDHLSFCSLCAETNTCGKLKDHLNNFYAQSDFDAMKEYGLNTVRIPLGYWYFTELSRISAGPYILPEESIFDVHHPLTRVIGYAKQSSLSVILTLESVEPNELAEGDSVSSATIATASAMAFYIGNILPSFGLDNVILLELNFPEPSARFDRLEEETTVVQTLQRVREVHPTLPLMVLEKSYAPVSKFNNLFVNTKVFHGLEVSDVASDSSAADREKMFAHEKIACGFKAPLHFTTCMRAPTLVGEFSLAIDNCMPQVDPNYANYGTVKYYTKINVLRFIGQCDHIDERISSPWWNRHSKSFAMRQIDTFERELGWVFLTYKMDATAEQHSSGIYWSFRKAVDNGLIDMSQHADECLHVPAADFVLGDDTLSPTAEPQTWHWDASTPTSHPTLVPGTTFSSIKDTKSFLYGLLAAAILFGFYLLTRWFSPSRYTYTAVPDNDTRA